MANTSDKQRYESNLFFNIKYLIRDVFTYSQIKELVSFAQDILEDKKDGGYDWTKQNARGYVPTARGSG